MSDKRFDSDTDELIWAAAESDDPGVQSEFERRYPHLRAELATRKTMIKVLRQSRPDARSHVATSFSRHEPLKRQKRSEFRPAFAALGLVGLFTLSTAAFFVTRAIIGPSPAANPALGNPSAHAGSGATNRGEPQSPKNEGEPAGMMPPVSERGTAPRPPEDDPANKRIELKTTNLKLMDALSSITLQSGVQFTVLPGVDDELLKLGDVAQLGPTMSLTLLEAVDIVERSANVRILDNGSEGYIVMPLDKVRNMEPPPGSSDNSSEPRTARSGTE